MIDKPRITTYLPDVADVLTDQTGYSPPAAAEPKVGHTDRVRRRGLPSPEEQKRRVAQMTALGNRTGPLIRAAIARGEQ